VPAAKCCIKSCGEAFARNVTDIETDLAVRKSEIVEIVAANFRNRLKFVGHKHTIRTERLRGEHGPLDHAGLLDFLFAQFFDGEKVLQRRSSKHGNVRGEKYTGRETASAEE
jgi:hypothetical protein